MKHSKVKQKLKPIHFLESILQIIEEKKINYPKFVYCFMIVVLYSQYAGYIFSTYESKPLLDEKIIFFAHWNEISPPDFLLYMMGIDLLTLIFYGIMDAILVFCLIYIIVFTILRKLYPEILHNFEIAFKLVNSFYQIFFSSFLWVFYIPFTEVHAGVMVIGGNSFLTEYRDATSYSVKPIYFIFIGSLGITLALLLGIILSYCYITYDFHEKNLLKRSFKYNLVLQLFARTLLVSLYYLNISNIVIIKHMIGHALGITALYDFFKYIPFRDEFICTFYGCATAIYEYVIILFSFWELTNILLEYNLFYLWIVPSVFIIVFIAAFYRYKFFNVLEIHPKKIDKHNINNIDLFLEIIYELTLMAESQKVDKMKLFGIINQLFKYPIQGLNLFEREKFSKILTPNQEIDRKKIISILNELFQIFLNDKNIKKNRDVYENILMKYCTFLSNFQNNPIKAFFELQKLLVLGQIQELEHSSEKGSHKPSIIFTIVSNLISEQIEGMIAQTFMYRYKIILDTTSQDKYKKIDDKQSENKLSLTFFPRANEICYLSISEFCKVIQEKIVFYEKLHLGFKSLEDVQMDGCTLMSSVKLLKYKLEDRINQIVNESWRENLIVLKLQSLFFRLILNDRLSSIIYEDKIHEIIKKDCLIINSLSRASFLKSKTIILSISLLKQGSLIINKKTNKLANFFGYPLIEFQNILTINKLMPSHLSDFHQHLVDRFIKKGPSNIFNIERPVYAINKKNYAFPVSLQLTLSFFYENDFCVSALVTKINSNTMDIIFKENGEIMAMTESFQNQMPELKKYNINSLYSDYNFFYFMPEMLEKMPSEEILKNLMAKKDYIFEIFPNKVLPFYFFINMPQILIYLKSYLNKNNENIKNRKFYRRFINSSNCKTLFFRKLIQFSLKLEIYVGKDKKTLKLYYFQIKHVFDSNDMNNDEYISYTGGLSHSTGQSETYFSNTSSTAVVHEKSKDMVTSLRSKDFIHISTIVKAKTNMNNNSVNEVLSPEPDVNAIDERKMNNLIKSDSSEENEKKSKESKEFFEGTDKMHFSNNDDNQRGPSSLSSNIFMNKANLGEYLLKDIVNNKKPVRLLRKILFLSLIQIGFFFILNVIYLTLVDERIQSLNKDFTDIQNQMTFVNAFYMSSFISNLFFLEQNKIINYDDMVKNNEIIQSLLEDSYLKLKGIETSVLFEENNDILNIIFYNNNNQIHNKITQNYSVSMQPLLITTFVYELLVNGFEKTSIINFLRGNFLTFNNLNSLLINNKLDVFESSKDNLMAFYLYLSLIAIICGFFLQIFSFPFIKSYSRYLEKIYFLSTRLQEKECELEIIKLKTALTKLESHEEAYLTYDFEKLDEIKYSDKSAQQDTAVSKGKSKKSYNVSYLSSKILNNRLSKSIHYRFFLLSIIIVGVYYTGIFIYMNKIQNSLDFTMNIIRYTSSYYVSLGKLDLLRMMIFTHRELNESYFLSDNIYFDMNQTIQKLKDSNGNNLKENSEDYLGNIFSTYKNLLINDFCQIDINTQNICYNFSLNNLDYGIQGYSSYLYNKIFQFDYIFEQVTTNIWMNVTNINENLLLEGSLNKTLRNFQVLHIALQSLLDETQNITSKLLNVLHQEMMYLLLIGGLGCSLFWLGINILRYKQMKNEINLSKEMLRLIPLAKLVDEATIHLLKVLEKN